MTFSELLDTLPNGLHDAELHGISFDYEKRQLVLEVEAWIGRMDEPPVKREAYRRGRLVADQVGYFAVDPPDSHHDYDSSSPGSVRIDAGEEEPGKKQEDLPNTPSGHTANWIFLSDHNCYIRFTAVTASLEWTGETHLHAGADGGCSSPGRRHYAPGEQPG